MSLIDTWPFQGPNAGGLYSTSSALYEQTNYGHHDARRGEHDVNDHGGIGTGGSNSGNVGGAIGGSGNDGGVGLGLGGGRGGSGGNRGGGNGGNKNGGNGNSGDDGGGAGDDPTTIASTAVIPSHFPAPSQLTATQSTQQQSDIPAPTTSNAQPTFTSLTDSKFPKNSQPLPMPSASSFTGSLSFAPPQNATACSSLTFFWDYSGPPAVAMTLQIFSSASLQSSAPASAGRKGITATPVATLTNDTSLNTQAYTWSIVNVDEGSYIAVAFDTSFALNLLAESSPFFVAATTQSSCIDIHPGDPVNMPMNSTGGTSPMSAERANHVLEIRDIIAIAFGVAAAVVLLAVTITLAERMRVRRRVNAVGDHAGRVVGRPHLLY